MDVFLYIAGAATVCAALLDVFFTVLFPASGQGPIRKPLAVAVWQGFRFIAASLPLCQRTGGGCTAAETSSSERITRTPYHDAKATDF